MYCYCFHDNLLPFGHLLLGASVVSVTVDSSRGQRFSALVFQGVVGWGLAISITHPVLKSKPLILQTPSFDFVNNIYCNPQTSKLDTVKFG